MKDYYYILGLKDDASTIDVKKAFRKLSLKFHPDKNDGDKFFEERFKDILEAYETLSDESLRAAYDAKRDSTSKGAGQSYSQRQSSSIPAPRITELKADRYTIEPGDIVKISWNTENATSVHLNCFEGAQNTSGTKSVRVSNRSQELIIAIEAKNQNTNAVARREITLRSIESEIKKPDVPSKVETNEKSNYWGFISMVLVLIVIVALCIQFSKRSNVALSTNESPPQEAADADSLLVANSLTINNNLSPTETIQLFFKLVNARKYKLAYMLTNDSLWHPYENFANNAWGNLSNLQAEVFMKKDFLSMYGGDMILEAGYHVYDEDKKINEMRTHDFHLKKNAIGNWQIIRLTEPQTDYPWYEDDPLQGIKNDLTVAVLNRPHALLQSYFDNYKHRDLARSENGKYYIDELIVYHGKDWVTREDAVNMDYQEFVSNNIFSYEILVDSYKMFTERLDGLNFVHVPLNYYVTKNDSTRTKYTVSIDALLDEDCTVILALGQNLTLEQIKDALEAVNEVEN
jgi:curved DNA-binding protein CbpA